MSSEGSRAKRIRQLAGSMPGTVTMSVTAHDVDDPALQAYASASMQRPPGQKLGDLRRKAAGNIVTMSDPYRGQQHRYDLTQLEQMDPERTYVLVRWTFKPENPIELSRSVSREGLR